MRSATFGWRWLLVDGLWATFAGLGVGALLGLAVGRLVLYLRREHKEAVGLDDFLAMGLIALSYGVALLLHAYGFLAVFAAGVALRHLEQSESSGKASQQAVEQAKIHPDRSVAEAAAVDPQHAPAYMAQAVLGFNQQVERIGELAVVITIGALLWSVRWHEAVWWFVPLLLLLIRPVSVAPGAAQVAQFQSPALAHRLVRHSRHRLAVLPAVRHQSRRVGRACRSAHRLDAVRGCHVDHRAWNFRDAADGGVRADQQAPVPALAGERMGTTLYR